MKASNDKYTHHQRWILNYFSAVRPLFVKGTIRFRSEKKGIMLTYHQADLQGGVVAEALIPYKSDTNEGKRGTVRLVQDFIISCYYEFERDKNPMKLKDLSRLCGISISTLSESITITLNNAAKAFIPQGEDGNKFL